MVIEKMDQQFFPIMSENNLIHHQKKLGKGKLFLYLYIFLISFTFRTKTVEPSEVVHGEAGPSGVNVSVSHMLTEETAVHSVFTSTAAHEGQPADVFQTEVQQSGVVLEAENYLLKVEVENLRKELQMLKLSFSFKHLENNPRLISVYTGIPTKEIFLSLFSLYENMELNYFRSWQVVRMPKIDQLLLTLMKLKLNLLNDDLAQRFSVSRETVSVIFKTWPFALHETLFQQLMKEVPSRKKKQNVHANVFQFLYQLQNNN